MFILFVSESPSASDLPGAVLAGLFAFIGAVPVIALAAALIGLPLTWLLARHKLEGPLVYPLAGFVAGALIVTFASILPGFGRGGPPLDVLLFFGWVGAVPGFISGAIWWRAYRRHAQGTANEDR